MPATRPPTPTFLLHIGINVTVAETVPQAPRNPLIEASMHNEAIARHPRLE